ncbi:hypothetical protein A8L34_02395 [Bacillus sp. FJAT-27264]|uniref:hypothetical protein n=1 Tax=Paenibacillus sp. (strain DSM 101736 / FJAT-27264) TaxID=1850362 RepID=UPI000807CE00|nr:hypothetical protein [Bacillus sp. FJAT-27264]OBZ18454.1 hypothetical protein A8L34_02395 [Bacillus sp. FJAT-27264]
MKVTMPSEAQIQALVSGKSSSLNVKLELQSQTIRLQKGFDRLVCLSEIDIEPRPWQTEAAMKVLRDMGSAIYAYGFVLKQNSFFAQIVLNSIVAIAILKTFVLYVTL